MTDPVNHDDLQSALDSLRWSIDDKIDNRIYDFQRELDLARTRIEDLERSLVTTQTALTAFIYMDLDDDRGRQIAEKLIQDQSP